MPEVVADLRDIAAAFEMKLAAYSKPNTPAVTYRFTNAIEQRAPARAEIAAALKEVRSEMHLSWAEWARRARVSYGMLNVWHRGECAPSLEELERLAVAANVPVSRLAPNARERAEAATPIARFLERHGLRGSRAADKAVPVCVFRLPKPQLSLFLRTLFTGDGSVFLNGRGLAGFSY